MPEFAFIKERKANNLLDNAASNILDFVSELSATERAAALAWSNAALLAGVHEYGKAFAYTPMKIERKIAIKAVNDFGHFREQIEGAATKVHNRGAHDPAVSAYKWELLGSQVVILTAGASLHKDARDAARAIWRILETSKPHARQAVQAMSLYSKAYDVDAIPQIPRKEINKSLLLSLASTLPPMFRQKKNKRS